MAGPHRPFCRILQVQRGQKLLTRSCTIATRSWWTSAIGCCKLKSTPRNTMTRVTGR